MFLSISKKIGDLTFEITLVHQARTHIDNITATYQINNLTTQTSREGSKSTKHERRPPEDGQTIVTETCRVSIDVFYKHF